MTVEVQVYEPDGTTLIDSVPRRKGVAWQNEFSTPGNGTFQLHLDDEILTTHPGLLDDFNIVKFLTSGEVRKAWVIESKQLTWIDSGEGAARWVTVSGRGVLSLLGNAVVYPEYAIRRDSADLRSFDYGSKDGGWRVESEWHAPLGIRVNSATSIRKGYPIGWPDRGAYWLWRTSPNAANTAGTNWFRGQFTLGVATRVSIYAAGDDRMHLQLDGEEVISRGWRGWRRPAVYTADLAAGTHLIAAAVQNNQSVDPLRSGAFLCSVARVDRNGKILSWIKRSTPTSFIVKGYGRAPGWFSASILKTLVEEAQARDVQGLADVTFDFTDSVDSDGAAWTGRHDRAFEVGQRDLLDVLAQLTETDLDVDMTGDMVLHAWKNRGSDLSASVTLDAVMQHVASSSSSRIRNQALIRHGGGWMQRADNPSKTLYGRRETGMITGSTQSDDQGEVFSDAAFLDLGRPEATLQVVTTDQAGPQPWDDYDVGDVVTAPGLLEETAPARLMALSVAESETNGVLSFTHELYPED